MNDLHVVLIAVHKTIAGELFQTCENPQKRPTNSNAESEVKTRNVLLILIKKKKEILASGYDWPIFTSLS